MFNNVYPFLPQANTRTALSLRGAQRATWQSPGREDLLAYTTTPNTRPRWLTTEKSPAVETETIVHDYPKTCPQGLPALPVAARHREIPRGRDENNRTPITPKHLPVAARHREIPRGRDENNRTPITPKHLHTRAPRREIPRIRNENNRTRLQKNTRPRRICVPTVETVRHIHAPARSPVAARHREIPPHQKRKQTHTITRILARRGSLPCPRGLRAERERHTNRNYPCGTVYIFPKVCYNTENATAKTENEKRRITATKNRRRKAQGNRKTTRRGQTVRRGRRNPRYRRIIPKESR